MDRDRPDFVKIILEEVVKFKKTKQKIEKRKLRNSQKIPDFKNKAITK